MEKLVYTRKEFIDIIAENAEARKDEVASIIQAMENVLPELLSQATADTAVAVRLSGISFSSKYMDGRVGRNPRTGESVNIEAKLKPSAQFTDGFKFKMNL